MFHVSVSSLTKRLITDDDMLVLWKDCRWWRLWRWSTRASNWSIFLTRRIETWRMTAMNRLRWMRTRSHRILFLDRWSHTNSNNTLISDCVVRKEIDIIICQMGTNRNPRRVDYRMDSRSPTTLALHNRNDKNTWLIIIWLSIFAYFNHLQCSSNQPKPLVGNPIKK